MAQIKFCSQCGAPLTNANANFCSQCGYKFERIEEVATPAVEAPAKNTDGLVKNSYYAKYSRNLGIVGLVISSIMCLMITLVAIPMICNYDGYNWYLSSTELSFNSVISYMSPWHDVTINNLLIVVIPIVSSFIACYYLRRFADAQTTPDKAAHTRKIASGVLIATIGWLLSFAYIVVDSDPYYYYCDYGFANGSHTSFFNLLGVAISLLGVLLVWNNLRKMQASNLASEGAKRFVKLATILTLLTAIVIATEFVVEFIFKCCAYADVVDYEGVLVVLTLYTLLHIALFAIVGVISLFAIISLSKSAPQLSAEEYNAVETRVVESNSPKSKLTCMLYIFAGIAIVCCVSWVLILIESIAFSLDLYISSNANLIKHIFGAFGLYIPLMAIATMYLINKTSDGKKTSLLGYILMIAGGTLMYLLHMSGVAYFNGNMFTFIYIHGGLALAAGYFLYIWTAECDILSKIIITAAALYPLSNYLTALMDAPYAVTALHAMLNQIVCAAAYIYVIIRLNGRENVIAKWRELILGLRQNRRYL